MTPVPLSMSGGGISVEQLSPHLKLPLDELHLATLLAFRVLV